MTGDTNQVSTTCHQQTIDVSANGSLWTANELRAPHVASLGSIVLQRPLTQRNLHIHLYSEGFSVADTHRVLEHVAPRHSSGSNDLLANSGRPERHGPMTAAGYAAGHSA